jgi:hypothetical protein
MSTPIRSSKDDISLPIAILDYGDWKDYLEAEEILGIRNTRVIFDNLKSKPRPNLRRKTIYYFDKNFSRYA